LNETVDIETARCVANVLIAADIGYYSAGLSHAQTIQRFMHKVNLPPKARAMLAHIAGLKRAEAAVLVRNAIAAIEGDG